MRAPRAIVAAVAAVALPAVTCATFCVRGTDGFFFGRNYDYSFGVAVVLVNNRGVEKISLVDRNPARRVSRYGSVTFNQYGGKGSPIGGINERGLADRSGEVATVEFLAGRSREAFRARTPRHFGRRLRLRLRGVGPHARHRYRPWRRQS